MNKKNFGLDYIPAVCREFGSDKWYIEYSQVNPATGELQRFRKTHNLNRTKNLQLRRQKAQGICRHINSLLQFGFPFNVPAPTEKVVQMKLLDAIKYVLKIKLTSKKVNSRRTNISQTGIFSDWLREKNLESMFTHDFNPGHAQAFMDYILVDRKAGNTTYNNYHRTMTIFFNQFIARGWYPKIDDSPFSKIAKMKKVECRYRVFTDVEKKIVAKYFYENSIWIFYGILLQYYCYIRPIEITRLKRKNFDLEKGLVMLSADITKTNTSRSPTIPSSVMHYFLHPRFQNIPPNDSIIGPGLCPGPTHYGEKNDKIYKRHRKGLKYLLDAGELDDIENLVWYSWKYTGNDAAEESGLGIEDISSQNGHASLDQTRTYLKKNKKKRVNIANQGRLFDLF